MNAVKAWSRWGVLLGFPVAACSTLVGADFDGLGPVPAGGSAGSVTAGGTESTGTNDAGTASRIPVGGVGGESGSNQGGDVDQGGTLGGVGGEPVGGEAGQGGAPHGGAGHAGDDAGGAGGTPDIGVPPDDVVLNELKGQGSGDDYIELYNPGTEAADIGGCYVTDDSNNRVTFPQNATIAAKSYVVVRLQQATSTGMETTCFGFPHCYLGVAWGIAASGELIFLRDAKGVILDQLEYPDETGPNDVGNGNAFGRIPDGANATGAILTSPGAANVAVQ